MNDGSTKDIGPDDGFFDLGGNSLLAMSVIAELDRRFAAQVPPSALFDAPTVPQLAELIRAPKHPNSMVAIRPGGAQVPLFLIHDVDGTTLLYRNLAYKLADERPVYGLQPLLDDDGIPQHTRIEDMAAHYVAAIRGVQASGPYLLGGLCAGGVIAFEIALQLRRAGQDVAMVALIDAANVDVTESVRSIVGGKLKRLSDALSGVSDQPLPQRIAQSFGILARKARNAVVYEAQSRREAEQVNRAVRQLQAMRDAHLSPSPQSREVTVRQVYNLAATEYTQSARLHGNVILFRATKGSGILGDRATSELVDDATLGWQEHVEEPIRCVDIAGGHSSMLQEPNVDELATAMQAYIDATSVAALRATTGQAQIAES